MARLFPVLLRWLAVLTLAVGASGAFAKPGCYGRMWNPLRDVDFKLMGSIRAAGFKLMDAPSKLGDPPAFKPVTSCTCSFGWGVGLNFWLPSYLMDTSRYAGCMQFLGSSTTILDSYVSLSSAQEWGQQKQRKDGVTNMQVHWAYADITAIAGKALFEKCGEVTSSLNVAYMTEVDFVYQNDVYSTIMMPLNSVLAAAPLLSQMACGIESAANTLGSWQDTGICAWKGTRYPMSGTSVAKSTAQESNMDVAVKFLSRQALLGVLLKTTGPDTICKPKWLPVYDPFQHRYQWAYPNRTSTRFNQDVMRWGMKVDGDNSSSMVTLTNEAAAFNNNNANVAMGSGGSGAPTSAQQGAAQTLLSKVPHGLNYPTREAGYLHVWEARQCCLIIITPETIVKMIVNWMAGDTGIWKDLYQYYQYASTLYTFIKDPVGGVLGLIGDGIGAAFGAVGGAIGGAASGIGASLGGLTS